MQAFPTCTMAFEAGSCVILTTAPGVTSSPTPFRSQDEDSSSVCPVAFSIRYGRDGSYHLQDFPTSVSPWLRVRSPILQTVLAGGMIYYR